MSSRTASKLIGEVGDGTTVELVTSGGYDLAGIVYFPATEHYKAHWSIVAKGSSHDSVRSRTITAHGRCRATQWRVIPCRRSWPGL